MPYQIGFVSADRLHFGIKVYKYSQAKFADWGDVSQVNDNTIIIVLSFIIIIIIPLL